MQHRSVSTYLTVFLLAALLVSCQSAPEPPEPGMVQLFDGKSLDNFEIMNGTAPYEIVGDTIVGTTAEGSPNTFLSTRRDYGDFILEFEVMVDPVLNSGVQIRSHQYAEDTVVLTSGNRGPVERSHEAGRVHGLQIEIANEAGGVSGGIYDEARRGWVDNIRDDPVASKAFKDNQWNHYRIEAIGDSVKTFVNGVPCADLVDSVDLSGFISFQVHNFDGEEPAQVRWRNIWIKDLGEHAWEPLFDGQTLAGWTPNDGGTWEVVDGAIKATNTASGNMGMLMSEASYEDLTVRLQFKAVKGNSGFFFRTAEVDGELKGLEVEIDEAQYVGGLYEVGGRAYVVQPDDETVASYFRPGEWNSLTASAHGRRLVFQINNTTTVDLPDDPGRLSGNLGLQVHPRPGAEMWFRDIEILQKVQ